MLIAHKLQWCIYGLSYNIKFILSILKEEFRFYDQFTLIKYIKYKLTIFYIIDEFKTLIYKFEMI